MPFINFSLSFSSVSMSDTIMFKNLKIRKYPNPIPNEREKLKQRIEILEILLDYDVFKIKKEENE